MAEKFVLTAQLNLQAPTNVRQVLSSMQKDLQSVSVDVNVKKGPQTVKQLNQIAKATKQVEKSTKGAETGADRMGKAFGSALKNVLRYDLARRVFSAFTNTIEQGIQDAIKFEREMIKIAQVSGVAVKELKNLERTVTSLSTSLGVSSAGLVKIGLILKQTGLSVDDTRIAMEALAKTELAPTFDNITNTAETAVAAMRQFRLEASQLETLLSKINTVAANFAVEASDIGVAIKRAGGAFRSAGGEVEELIALFTSVRATTRETAETIATGFRTIFTRMQRPTTIKFLRKFGIELTNLQGQFIGPYEAVKRLSSALQGLESTDLRFSAIVEQLGGFRQVSKVIPLIQEFSTAQAAYKAQLQGTDSLANDAEKAQQSLAIQIMKLTENIKELFREIANSTAFKEMAKFALMFANAAVKLGKALAPIIPMLAAMMAFRGIGWAGGKLFKGGLGGLNSSMGSAMGTGSDAFKGSRGGRVPKRFSGGGWVGGSGSGDTVPAMLEPGEFVLRKSAAQAYGSSLNSINSYGKGGVAITTGKSLRKMSGVGGMFNEVGKRNWSKRAERAWRSKGKTVDQFNNEDSFEITNKPRNIRITATQLEGQGHLVNKLKSGAATRKGRAWEKLLANTGNLRLFGGSSPALDGMHPKHGMGDAAWTKTAHTNQEMANKSFRHLWKSNKAGLLDNLNTHVGKDAFKLPVKEVSEFLPDAITKKNIKEFGTVKARKASAKGRRGRAKARASIITRQPGSGWKSDQPLAHQFASGGEVASLLTPGEFVVNRKSAQSFGYGNLRNMNRYAGGGTVRRYAAGTGGTGVMGGGMGSMMMPMMMSNMMESTGKATKGIYGMGEGAMGAFFKLSMLSAGVDMAMDSMGQTEGATRNFTDVLMKAVMVLGTVKGAMGKGGGGGMLDKAVNYGMLASMAPKKGIGGAIKRLGGKALAGGAKSVKGVASGGLFWSAAAKQQAKALKTQKVLAKATDLAAKHTARQSLMLQKEAAMRSKSLLHMKDAAYFEKTRAAAQKLGHASPKMGGGGGIRGQAFSDATINRQGRDNAKRWGRNAMKEAKIAKEAAARSGKVAAKATKTAVGLGKAAKAALWAGRAIKALTVVLIVAEIAVDLYGKKLQKSAKESMEKAVAKGDLVEGGAREQQMRAQYQKGAMISGAAQGAGIGALIGGFFGPFAIVMVPLLAVIGAITGGIWGWYAAGESFEKFLQKARFQKAMDDMSDAMEKFSEGTITNASAIAQVTTSFGTMQRNVGGAGIGGAAKGFGTAAINTEKLFRSMGQSADSMDEFEANLTHNFGPMREQGMLQGSLIKEIRAETKARIESQEKMRDWLKAQIDAAKSLARLKGIAKVFDVVGERVKNFGDVVQAIANPISAINFGGGIEAGLSTTGRDKGSIARFNKSVDSMSNMAGETGGTGLGEYQQTVKDQGFLERNMANILTISAAGSATGDIKGSVEKQLEAALDVEGHGMSKDMREHFDKALDAMDAVDLKDMSKLEANVKQFTAAHEEYLETFKRGAKLLDDHNKNLMGMYAAKNKLEIAGVKNDQEIQKVKFKAEQDYLRGIQGPGVDFKTDQADIDADFSARQQRALQEVGTFKGAFGQDVDATKLEGPEAIGKAFQQISRDLRESNKALQDQGLKGVTPGAGESLASETNAQIAANAKLRKQYELLGNVLDKYKSTQERLIAINEKIAKEARLQEALEDLAFNLAYGTAEEKEESAYLVNQIEKVRAAGTVLAADPEMQRTIGKWMKTQGMEGGQEMVMRDIAKSLHAAGAAFTALGGNYAGITTATDKMVKLRQQQLQIADDQVKAMTAGGDELASRADAIKTAITSANREFLTALKALFIADRVDSLKQEGKVMGAEVKAITDELNVLIKLGLDPRGKTEQQKLEMTRSLDFLKVSGAKYAEAQEKSRMTRGGGAVQYRGKDWGGDLDTSQDIGQGKTARGFLDMTRVWERAVDFGWTDMMDRMQTFKTTTMFPTRGGARQAGDDKFIGVGLNQMAKILMGLDEGDKLTWKHMEKLEFALDEWAGGENQEVTDFSTAVNRAWYGTDRGRSGMAEAGATGGIMQNLQKKFGSDDFGGMNLYEDVEGGFYAAMDKIIGTLLEKTPGAEAQDLIEAIMNDIQGRQEDLQAKAKDMRTRAAASGTDADRLAAFENLSVSEKQVLATTNLMDVEKRLTEKIEELNATMQRLHETQGKEGTAKKFDMAMQKKGMERTRLQGVFGAWGERIRGRDVGSTTSDGSISEDQKWMREGMSKQIAIAANTPGMRKMWLTQRDEEGKTFDQRARTLQGSGNFQAMKNLLEEYADAVRDNNEAAAAEYYHKASNPGSIYTRDKRVEAVLIAMLSAMQKGAMGLGVGGNVQQQIAGGMARASTEKTAALSWEKEATARAEQKVQRGMDPTTRAALIAKERGEKTFLGEKTGGIRFVQDVEKYLTTKPAPGITPSTRGPIVADDKEQQYKDAVARQKELELIKMREEGYDPIKTQQEQERRAALTPEQQRKEDMQKTEGGVGATALSMGGYLKKSVIAGWSQLMGGEKVDQGDPAERDAKKITLLEQARDALLTLAAAAAGGAEAEDDALGMFDTKAFGESVALFSTSATELSKALGSPVRMEVTGKVEMVVQIKGAEVFEDAKDAFTQLVVGKVNTGIKNFVKHMKSAGGNLDGNLDFAEGNNQAKPGGNGGD